MCRNPTCEKKGVFEIYGYSKSTISMLRGVSKYLQKSYISMVLSDERETNKRG